MRVLLSALLFLCTLSAPLAGAAETPSVPAPTWAEVRKQRIRQLLPSALSRANVDAWVVVCRENANGWAPDQNPNVNSGPDRGHSHATDRVIQPGDFIQTDFGIAVQGRWVTDIQRFAYVLAPGETKAPPEALAKWEAQKGLPAKGASARLIRPGQVFAFDGFFAWKLPTEGETKTLSVEEMAVVTETGAEYLIPPQEELILIPSKG